MKKLLSILLTVSVLGLVGCGDEQKKESEPTPQLKQKALDKLDSEQMGTHVEPMTFGDKK